MALTRVVESGAARCGRPEGGREMREDAGAVAGDTCERVCLPHLSLTENNMVQGCLSKLRKMKKIKHLLIKLTYC